MAKPVYILNGPNLNLLGQRMPALYGPQTLEDLERNIAQVGHTLGLETILKQSNSEGELVTLIHEAAAQGSGLIINAAAYSHTSVALRDALETCDIPIVEVHISNIFKRESFRHHSYISEVVDGVICGLGIEGYELALRAVHRQLKGDS